MSLTRDALLTSLVALGIILPLVACRTKAKTESLPDQVVQSVPEAEETLLSGPEVTSTLSVPQNEFSFIRKLWPTNESTNNMVVLGDTANYPDDCSPNEVAETIQHFFEAYNSDSITKVSAFFAPKFRMSGISGWFSDTIRSLRGKENEAVHFSTSNSQEFLEYVGTRQEQQDNLHLLLIHVYANTAQSSTVHIGFVFRREAADLQPGSDGLTRIGSGKGVVDCPTRNIIAWSMAMPEVDENEEEIYHQISSCSHLFEQIPSRLVVCARESSEG